VDRPEAYATPHFSPDGKRLLVSIFNDGRYNLWIRDLDRGSMSQLTFDQNVHSPQWLDARTVLFTTADGVHVLRADGSGKPRRILDTALTLESVSSDGRKLAVTRRADKTARDVFIVPLEGAGDAVTAGQPVPFLETAADEINPAFSPDGRWIAYATGDQGNEYAVYVRPASGAGGQWLIQGSGLGFKPVWAPSGNRLFFQMGTGELMTADYSVSGASFVVGAVKPFGPGRSLMRIGAAPTYFVTASGRVGTLAAPPETAAGSRRASHTIFLNFLDEIARRAAKAGSNR
jgi:serine/threonine-protein kinase